jgi:hypothetical protein
MAIEITWYKDTLRSQVITLFVNEYGVDATEFNALFERFYFHPFQKNKCLLIVAMDGETVAGFQSFFYWPYSFQGKTYTTFQSGNSLVNPLYRGQGLFNKMLSFISNENKTTEIDFLMGFPVDASLRNFKKDNWKNILNLQWYLRLCNPFGFTTSLKGKNFSEGCHYFSGPPAIQKVISLNNSEGFSQWRDNYMKKGTYFSYHYKNGTEEIIFHLKKNKRKKLLNELVIGNILYNNEKSVAHTPAALKALVSKVRGSFSFHFVSIALNEHCSLGFSTELKKAGFRRTEKSIYFIVKSFKENSFSEDPANWLLFRSDIDTW